MFLYYLPNEHFKRWPEWLWYAFDGEPLMQPTETGPAGPGMILANQTVDIEAVKLAPGAQTLRRIRDTQAWAIRYNHERLRASLCQRPELLSGVAVKMAGEYWQVAHARKFIELDQQLYIECPLPKVLDLDDETGKWLPTLVVERYQRLNDLADAYVKAGENGTELPDGRVQFVFNQTDELCIEGLRANYRIGPTELALCPGSYTQELRSPIIAAILDSATHEAYQKKSGRVVA